MKKTKQLGISMLEVVIGMAIAGVVIAFAAQIQRQSDDGDKGRANAETLSSFAQLATQYVTSNRTAMEAAMDGTDATTYCRVNVNADGTGGSTAHDPTLKTCAFDASFLRANGLWPSGMSIDADADGRYVAVWRKLYNGSTATGAIEAMILHASPSGVITEVNAATVEQNINRWDSGMNALGSTGGIVPVGEIGGCKAERSSTTYQACGGAWTVNLSDFISSAQLTTFANALPN